MNQFIPEKNTLKYFYKMNKSHVFGNGTAILLNKLIILIYEIYREKNQNLMGFYEWRAKFTCMQVLPFIVYHLSNFALREMLDFAVCSF